VAEDGGDVRKSGEEGCLLNLKEDVFCGPRDESSTASFKFKWYTCPIVSGKCGSGEFEFIQTTIYKI
jgi:hypothetical protein